MLKTKAKGQAGMALLAATDDDICVAMDGRAEERELARNGRLCRYAQGLRDMLSRSYEGRDYTDNA